VNGRAANGREYIGKPYAGKTAGKTAVVTGASVGRRGAAAAESAGSAVTRALDALKSGTRKDDR
jgi:hypothetical protein